MTSYFVKKWARIIFTVFLLILLSYTSGYTKDNWTDNWTKSKKSQFWFDAERIYKSARSVDSMIKTGISRYEFKKMRVELKVEFDNFADKYPELNKMIIKENGETGGAYCVMNSDNEKVSDECRFFGHIDTAIGRYSLFSIMDEVASQLEREAPTQDLRIASEEIKKARDILNKHR